MLKQSLLIAWISIVTGICVDDDETAKRDLTMDCKSLFDTNGGTCSLAGVLSAAATPEQFAYFWSVCAKTCKQCVNRWECEDNDTEMWEALGNIPGVETCAALVGANGDAGCALDGPGFSQAAALGISALQLDKAIFACPKACGVCVPLITPCEDDNDSVKAATTLTCPELVASNGGSCSADGVAIKPAIEGGLLSLEALVGIQGLCAKSCRLCMSAGKCKDDSDAAKAIHEECEIIAKQNGGDCRLTGPYVTAQLTAGVTLDTLERAIYECPMSCGVCQEETVCEDDDATASSIHDLVTDCASAVAANEGCSIYGPTFSLAPQIGLTEADLRILIDACRMSCRSCAKARDCRNYDISEFVPPGLDCEGLVGANGGNCDMDGPAFSVADQYGVSPFQLDQAIYNCPKACGVCQIKTCVDNDAEVISRIPIVSGCKQLIAFNRGSICGKGTLYEEALEKSSRMSVSADELLGIYEEFCGPSCGFCDPADFATPAPTMELIELIFMRQSPDQEVGTGGEYILLDEEIQCNGERVWKLNITGSFETYIISDTDGYWIVSNDASLNGLNSSNNCTSEIKLLRSEDMHNASGPNQVRWTRQAGATWIYDDAIRFVTNGCPGEAQCLQLNCQEPLDGYQCFECTLEFAQLSCSRSETDVKLILAIVICITALCLVVCNVIYASNKSEPVTPRLSRRFSVPTTGVQVQENIVVVFLQKYRKAFLQLMGALGNLIGRRSNAFIGTALTLLLVFTVSLPLFFEVDTGGSYSADWAPEGGRLERELNFVNKWRENSKQASTVLIMVGPEDTKRYNALSKHFAFELLRILQDITNITVPIATSDGRIIQVGYEDFCASVDHPILDQIMPGKKPCINPSVLDCFFEGGWQLDDVSQGKPLPEDQQSVKFKNLEAVYKLAKAASPGAITSYSGRPSLQDLTEEEVIERYSQSSTLCDDWVTSASLGRSNSYGSFTEDKENLTLGEPKLIWAEKIAAVALQYSAKRAKEFKISLDGIDERDIESALDNWFDAVQDRLEEINDDEINFPGTSVSVFMTVSLKRMFKEIGKAKVLQYVIGLTLMLLLTIASQFSRDRAENHVLVAVLGLGLVLLTIFASYGFLALVGVSFTPTMLQVLPFISLGLGVDDLFLLLHYYRAVPDKTRPTRAVLADLLRLAGVSVTLTSFCNAFAFFSGTIIPIPALRIFLFSAGFVVIINYCTMLFAFPALLAWECNRDRVIIESRGEEDITQNTQLGIQILIEQKFSPFMQKFPVKVSVTVLNGIFFLVCIITLNTSHPLSNGFDLVDLTPSGSFLSKGFQDIEEHFLSQRTSHKVVVATVDFNDPVVQQNYGKMLKELKYSRWASQDLLKGRGWWGWFFDFANDNEQLIKNETGDDPYYGAYINTSFYTTFHNWRNPVTGGLGAIAAQTTDGFGYRWGLDSYLPGNTMMLSQDDYTLNMAILKEPEDWLEHIDEFHDRMEYWMGKGNAFPEPSGQVLQMEQFNGLKDFFWQAFAVAACVILVSAIIVPVSIRGAGVICLTSLIGTIEVAAVMMMSGLSFSPLVACVLLMAMGIIVEFSAHVVAGYETTPGSRAERMHHAISHTFLPVLEGGLSSILSILMLVFNEFPYVVKYFFLIFLIVILVGLLHGLLFLPALVGIVGSVGGSDEQSIIHRKGSMGSFGRKIAVEPAPVNVLPANPLEAPRGKPFDDNDIKVGDSVTDGKVDKSEITEVDE